MLFFLLFYRFLTTLNAELELQPQAAKRIASLQNFVAVIFEQDGETKM
jgi:hypothetical protein